MGSMSRTRTVLFVAGILFLGFFAALFFVGTAAGRTLFAVALVLVVLVAGGNYLSDRSGPSRRRPVGVTSPAPGSESQGVAAPATPDRGAAASGPSPPDAPDPPAETEPTEPTDPPAESP
jgi:hypothetical protein